MLISSFASGAEHRGRGQRLGQASHSIQTPGPRPIPSQAPSPPRGDRGSQVRGQGWEGLRRGDQRPEFRGEDGSPGSQELVGGGGPRQGEAGRGAGTWRPPWLLQAPPPRLLPVKQHCLLLDPPKSQLSGHHKSPDSQAYPIRGPGLSLVSRGPRGQVLPRGPSGQAHACLGCTVAQPLPLHLPGGP